MKNSYDINDANNDLSTLSIISENNQNKNIQHNLQQSYKNFEKFIKYVDSSNALTIDINQIRNNFKIEIQEVMNSSKEILSIYQRLFEKYQNRKYFIRKIWWEKELIIFVWIIVKYANLKNKDFKQFTQQDWIYISSILPLKTPEECQLKLLGLEKISLQKIPWSQLEDQTLKKLICQKGALKWAETSKNLHEILQTQHFRSSKQCRERWNNYLNPKLKKGDWSNEEDIKLLQLAKIRGKRWAQISREMKGRNENTVKNRYNCLIKKAMKQKKNFKLMIMKIDNNQNFKICQQEQYIIDELLYLKQQIQDEKYNISMQYYENQNVFDESFIKNNQNNYMNLHNYEQQKKIVKLESLQDNNYDFDNYFKGKSSFLNESEQIIQDSDSKIQYFNLYSYEKINKNEQSFEKDKIICNMDDNFWNDSHFIKNDPNYFESFGQINQLQFSF